MGGASSSESSPPAPPKRLTDRPWREPSSWNEKLEQSLRTEIKSIHPREGKPSIVLSGPVGAGKSSFINAILSVAKGHKVDIATTRSGEKSCTTSYDKYTDKSLLQNFRLRDCMGVEQNEADGFNIADMVALLKGHIKDGYDFNPRSPISQGSAYYRENPKFEHQTHCVVFVIDSNAVSCGIPAAFVRKIALLQDEVKKLRVPRVLILTKADILCEEVQRDNTKMFSSVKVREAVKTASEVFRIPEASIHPVTNYEEAFVINWKKNIPLLIALREITHYANDRIDSFLDHSDSD